MMKEKITTQYFSEFVEEWLYSVEYKIAKSTYVKYEHLARNHIIPFFKDVTCDMLDNECLMRFYNKINEREDSSQKVLSMGNRRTIFMIVNNALEYAFNLNVLAEKYYIRPRLVKQKKVVRIFSQEDQAKIEQYILLQKDEYSLAVMLALFTGLRLGEICALQWKDINFEINSLYVNKTVQRLKTYNNSTVVQTELVVSQPKSAASYRLIPLPRFLTDYLKSFPHECQDAYILTDDPEKPMEPRTLQYHYKKILEKCNVPYLNFHCLRHTFATRCVTLGWDMKTLSEILGHFDIKVTMEYYFHSSFEFKKAQMDKISLLSQN